MHKLSNIVLVLVLSATSVVRAANVYVSPAGVDSNPGSAEKPVQSLAAAIKLARAPAEDSAVILSGGTYYLSEPIVLLPSAHKLVVRAAESAHAVVSGGMTIQLDWKPYRNGIFQADLPPGTHSDQLFVNGHQEPMARYPNFDAKAEFFNGTAADAISPQRAARWADPAGGFIHAMHVAMWGDFHYRITGKDAAGKLQYEGGWQNNRRMGMHEQYRFVENIFEELDAPGEWFLNEKTHTLYFYPPKEIDLKTATIELVRLSNLIEFRGTRQEPVRGITLRGLTFEHAARTFMDNKEPLLRSDWTTYRGGAILFAGAEDCAIEDCTMDHVGGNAIFASGYNRRLTIRGCNIDSAGANAVAFVGDPKSVRSPLFEYNQRQSYADIDKGTGPKTDDYPADCLVDECLIHESGRVEKQTAGVQISMSMGITVRHCSIYGTPRAGINISEGTFGGHVIEFCDIFDTVKETGDHGSFNSWGRDRYWGLQESKPGQIVSEKLYTLDMVKPNILRNSRWRCDHGWDIDLDDGSSNYQIYNNLCLNGGLKNREGYARVVENNVIINNSFHPHVWFAESHDIFRKNIVCAPYQPIGMNKPWGDEVDHNLLHRAGESEPQPATMLQKQSGRDEHSLVADAMFIDPAHGDFRVKDDSPALKLGFKNFPMDQFGVTKPELRKLAQTPVIPEIKTAGVTAKPQEKPGVWMGAKAKKIVGLGEISAAGLPGEVGVALLEVPADSAAGKAGLKQRDVVLKVGGKAINSLKDLQKLTEGKGDAVSLSVYRDQKEMQIEINTMAPSK